jgi:hypothetical protein
MKHDNKSAFLCIFQATIDGKTCQTEVSTKFDPMNSRQVRKDCEDVARASFAKLAKSIGFAFRSTDGIKCVEIIEVKNADFQEPTAADQ